MKPKHTLIILILACIFISCATKHNSYVSIPMYDTYSDKSKITHLWSGKENPIYTPNDLLKIWTDNGVVAKTGDDYTEYYIKPDRNGTVNIYTIHTENSKQPDTIKGVSTFKAITPPKFKTVIDTKLLKNSFVLEYDIVFEDNLKSTKGTRYSIGALPPSIKIFMDENPIGEIEFYMDAEEGKELLQKGNRLILPSLLIRDMKTGLWVSTEELDYKYR
ncbi:hypothetical protein LJC28_00800 [Dysgonomonas sp. OttesenSCG-928-D17]|nr:hypothetical protein [Dysgonomonas sp. OttesenSCG-928-D17]